jgi:hypothetical protein
MIGAQLFVVHCLHGIRNRVGDALIPSAPKHSVDELRPFLLFANIERGGVDSSIQTGNAIADDKSNRGLPDREPGNRCAVV